MFTLFWNCRDPFLKHYKPRETTANSKTYCDLVENHLKHPARSELCSLVSLWGVGVVTAMITHSLTQLVQQLNKL